MTDVTKHPLLRQAYELCLAVEACAASEAQTAASIKAGELLQAIDAEVTRLTAALATAQAEGFEAGKEAAAKVCEGFTAPQYWLEGDHLSATETQAAEEAAYRIGLDIRALVPGGTR